MRQPLTIWLGAIYFILATACIGCNRGPERVVVAGAVTYQGQSVPKGAITFTPCDGTVAPTTIAAIVDGKYNVEPARALPVGTYRVSIAAVRDRPGRVPRPVVGGQPPPPDPKDQEQYIPAKYNTQTQLKITLESSHGPLTRDFTLID